MDEKAAEAFPGKGDDVEGLNHEFSVFIRLPDGMSHPESVATDAVMRPGTLRKYARKARLSDIETLPIENSLWRFCRLVMGRVNSRAPVGRRETGIDPSSERRGHLF